MQEISDYKLLTRLSKHCEELHALAFAAHHITDNDSVKELLATIADFTRRIRYSAQRLDGAGSCKGWTKLPPAINYSITNEPILGKVINDGQTSTGVFRDILELFPEGSSLADGLKQATEEYISLHADPDHTSDRSPWRPYIGTRQSFTGRLAKYGCIYRRGKRIDYKQALLQDTCCHNGCVSQVQHLWIDTAPLLTVDTPPRVGALVAFRAKVQPYGADGDKIGLVNFDRVTILRQGSGRQLPDN